MERGLVFYCVFFVAEARGLHYPGLTEPESFRIEAFGQDVDSLVDAYVDFSKSHGRTQVKLGVLPTLLHRSLVTCVHLPNCL